MPFIYALFVTTTFWSRIFWPTKYVHVTTDYVLMISYQICFSYI